MLICLVLINYKDCMKKAAMITKVWEKKTNLFDQHA